MRVDTDRLILKESGKFGMDMDMIHRIATFLRSNPDLDVDEPILVKPTGAVFGGRQVYRIMEGRHRYFAYVIANRKSVPAELDTGLNGAVG